MLDVNLFESLKIGLARADAIRDWSNGEVKKPETINYRTLRPEKDGLFCEKIFGPTKDWECYCGKYKRVRFKGIICERCGVEVTRSKVRRERMGHIELAAPVVHIWYLRGTRSWLAYLLMGTEAREELKAKQLEKVIYFAANLVTWVDDERRHADLPDARGRAARGAGRDRAASATSTSTSASRRSRTRSPSSRRNGAKDRRDQAAKRKSADKDLAGIRERAELELDLVQPVVGRVPRPARPQDHRGRAAVARAARPLRRVLRRRHGRRGDRPLIDRIDFDSEEIKLREGIDASDGRKPLSVQRKQKAIKRLKIVTAFNRRNDHGKRINDPRAMILEAVPVIPPDLRPMVQLDGGRFATSDLNDLYRRVINRNNRLKRLLDLGAPEIIVNNEKRMLQEAVDALFDNGRRGRPVTGPGNRPLKSLSDMLKGKQGRFRQNLLGKRVDYSGRSVIVVGPTLKLHQCGLPKLMALELFKPFVMKRLVDNELAQNIKSAKRMVERRKAPVWDVLEEVIKEHPVFLNRAPTLHRLGIQAFEPILVEGKAIQIHPLVCTAFNADFDGDQMAVHLPLCSEAQAEARILMLSANNVLSPATGRPITVPTQDMVFGCYYLTLEVRGRHRRRPRVPQLLRGRAGVRERRRRPARQDHVPHRHRATTTASASTTDLVTTPGRLFFNSALPEGFPYVNDVIGKSNTSIGSIVETLAVNYPKIVVAESLDRIKTNGFRFGAQSGLTISIDDVKTPPEQGAPSSTSSRRKRRRPRPSSSAASSPTTSVARRKSRSGPRRTPRSSGRWRRTLASLPFNPINMMVDSGARGNPQQIASDRRHEGPRVQPPRRDDPPPDQVLVP